jgi:hypothetical protein
MLFLYEVVHLMVLYNIALLLGLEHAVVVTGLCGRRGSGRLRDTHHDEWFVCG